MSGGDPRPGRNQAEIPLFSEAMEAVISNHNHAVGWKNPKSAEAWRSTLTVPMLTPFRKDGWMKSPLLML